MRGKKTRLVDKLDNVFSVYIRLKTKLEYGFCPFCHGPIECCFHFISRRKHSVRWDENNAIGSCHDCNCKMNHWPAQYFAWYTAVKGQEALNTLIAKGNILARYGIGDLMDMIDGFKDKIEKLRSSSIIEPIDRHKDIE